MYKHIRETSTYCLCQKVDLVPQIVCSIYSIFPDSNLQWYDLCPRQALSTCLWHFLSPNSPRSSSWSISLFVIFRAKTSSYLRIWPILTPQDLSCTLSIGGRFRVRPSHTYPSSPGLTLWADAWNDHPILPFLSPDAPFRSFRDATDPTTEPPAEIVAQLRLQEWLFDHSAR